MSSQGSPTRPRLNNYKNVYFRSQDELLLLLLVVVVVALVVAAAVQFVQCRFFSTSHASPRAPEGDVTHSVCKQLLLLNARQTVSQLRFLVCRHDVYIHTAPYFCSILQTTRNARSDSSNGAKYTEVPAGKKFLSS
jgi:hypothetical protein